MNNESLVSIIKDLSYPLEPIPVGELPSWTSAGKVTVQAAESSKPQAEKSGISAVIFDIYGTLFVSGSGDIGTAEDFQSSEILGKLVLDAVFKLMTLSGLVSGTAGLPGFAGDLSLSGRVGMYVKKLLFKVIKKTHLKLKSSGIKYPEVNIRSVWKEVINELASLDIFGFPPGMGDINWTKKGDEIIDELAVRYECSANPVWPMPGSRELINFLKYKKVPIGIISNAQFYTPLIFKALLGSSPEDLGFNGRLLFYSYLFGEAKPSAAMFKSAASVLEKGFNIPFNSVLYVGNDMLNDIKPAEETGFKTALFAGDERSLRLREDDPKCRDIHPELVITDLRQIEMPF